MTVKVLLALDALSSVPAMSAGVRAALVAVLALLGVLFLCLVAFVLVMRRRPRPEPGRAEPRVAARDVMAYDIEDPMVCPACRRELEPGWRYCPHDARRLVPAPALLAQELEQPRRSRRCPRCRRAFPGGMRFCPHDGSDLVPMALVQPERADLDVEHEHDGRTAKICPACQVRYGYAATFCGKDGVELVVVN